MNKTATIFATLTARYGKPQPKDGQEFQAVAISFESALGAYNMRDLEYACSTYMASTKFPRWPEPGELLGILRSCGASPETRTKELPLHFQQAQNDAGAWYRGLIRRPLPENAYPFGWDDVLYPMIGVGLAGNRGKTFAALMTQAWLDNVISGNFEHMAREKFDQLQARRKQYQDAVGKHGAAAVHQGAVTW